MKRACQYVSLLNLCFIFCTFRAYEQYAIGLLGFVVLCVVFFGLMMLFAYLGGMFYNGRR